MKLILPLMFLFFAPFSFAQAKCSLTESPSLKGFRIGMNREEISKALGRPFMPKLDFENVAYRYVGNSLVRFEPYSKAEKKDFARLAERVAPGSLTQSFVANWTTSDEFSDVDTLELTIFQGRLIQIGIAYHFGDSTWINITEFTDNLSKKLALPSKAWKSLRQMSTLKCGTFDMIASIQSPNSVIVLLTDTPAEEALENATKAAWIARKDQKIRDVLQKYDPDNEEKKEFKP